MIKKPDSLRSSIGRGALLPPKRLDTGSYPGHSHFAQRALSRRQFMKATGAAAGLLLLGSSGWVPARAAVPGDTPKAIPGGFTTPDTGDEVFHNFAPGVFDPLDTD